MKKNLLAVLIASSIGLYGCGDEKGLSGNPTIDPIIEQSLKAETKIKFDIISDPENPVVVTPTFLAMDTMDGTLSVEGSNGDDGYLTDLTNPLVAMGKTDGWSTTQPFVIEFTGHDLDPATAEKGFYLVESNNPTIAKKAITPKKLTAADGYIQAIASGKKLTVILKKPLKPGTDYMFAITDELKDVKGNSVGMTGSYAVLKATANPPSEKLAPAQHIVHASEQELATVGIDADSIIFSSWFTTASVGNVLSTTKAVIAKTIEAVKEGKAPETIWKGEANPNKLDLSTLYQMNISNVGDIGEFFKNNPILNQLVDGNQTIIDTLATGYKQAGVQIYTGTVNLPYFLSDSTTDQAWKTTPWESAVPSLAKIKYIMTNGSDADKAAVMASLDGINITKLLSGDSDEFTKLIGLKITLADGSQLDEERLVTQYSPLPKVKSVAKVPVLLILPPNADPGAVIYQHGITSVKETAYLFGLQHIGMAAQTGAAPKAIIAIDHPLHGQRALKDGTVTTPATADVYMNLNYLNVARDNMRQSIIDSLGVRTSLAVMSQLHPVIKGINIGDVSFFGHSMGAITGIGTYQLGNQSLGLESAEQEAAAGALFNFTSGAFANPGGGIPSLLLESKTFGPTIKHSLLLGAKNDAYTAECGDAKNGGACFTEFFNSLDETTQGSINATFSSFAYAAQTVLDTVDPYNLASGVNGPVYVMQAENDSVVPNQTTAFSTFGGTEPLATQLGLSELKDSTNSVVKHIARFNAGSYAQHSTVIGPQYLDGNGEPINEGTAKTATAEAQLQVASFTAHAGKAVMVNNSNLIASEE